MKQIILSVVAGLLFLNAIRVLIFGLNANVSNAGINILFNGIAGAFVSIVLAAGIFYYMKND